MGKNARQTGHTRNSAASRAINQTRIVVSRVCGAGLAMCIRRSWFRSAASLEDDISTEQGLARAKAVYYQWARKVRQGGGVFDVAIFQPAIPWAHEASLEIDNCRHAHIAGGDA